ncbi:hypothetical protein [Campylobacter troglodytis]|nr:hypothetical protein [Campylobacter troglodytis]
MLKQNRTILYVGCQTLLGQRITAYYKGLLELNECDIYGDSSKV